MNNIINIDELALEMGEQKIYTLTLKGKKIEFELNLEAMEKIENKLGISIEELFMKMFVEDRTYNYLIELIDCVLGLEGIESLSKSMRFTYKNLQQLDRLLLDMAYEYCPDEVGKYIAENTLEKLTDLNAIE